MMRAAARLGIELDGRFALASNRIDDESTQAVNTWIPWTYGIQSWQVTITIIHHLSYISPL
jgi:hypothetical protein